MYLNMNKYGKFSLSSFDIYIIKILKEIPSYPIISCSEHLLEPT